MNITINELSRKTGVSAYEIRRRVHSGILPHMRVGAKQTKILINEDVFKQLLTAESLNNMAVKIKDNTAENIGYGKLRKID
jgi:hypothetical protein